MFWGEFQEKGAIKIFLLYQFKTGTQGLEVWLKQVQCPPSKCKVPPKINSKIKLELKIFLFIFSSF
jgi:hypothetical protein